MYIDINGTNSQRPKAGCLRVFGGYIVYIYIYDHVERSRPKKNFKLLGVINMRTRRVYE